ncbi:MAG: sigma-70 family RNA polymerase sigma factor [Leptospira sp.]|nr:sigma-70 family RNA polymerase sigma factor [Leptospira sp.]
MISASAQAIAISKSLEKVMKNDWGRLMAALTSQLGSIQLAEDALQEACISALVHWSKNGIPHSPQGWLIRVAYRKALNQIRSEVRSMKREIISAELRNLIDRDDEDIPDERLRLIFSCCHPALEVKSRVALTLRTVCGISTLEIARLFLDSETTMGQRLSRAKRKIAKAGIPFSIPEPNEWNERLQTVLTTIYLVFTTGYMKEPANSNRDLCGEAIFLTNLLMSLCPNEPEVEGALSLMLLTDSRRNARINSSGETVPPGEQNRSLWDRIKEAQGKELLEIALKRKKAGPFQIKAAISACQMTEPKPDWNQILELYTILLTMEPTPVVRLNQAVAIAETGNPGLAMNKINELEEVLKDYQPFYATKAKILAQLKDHKGSIIAYKKAIQLAENESDRIYLSNQLKLNDAGGTL